MRKLLNFTHILALVSVFTRILPCHGELKAVSAGRLPTTLRNTAAVFDGNDFIYLFGGLQGSNASPTTQIVRYNVTSRTAEVRGTMPKETQYGTAEASLGLEQSFYYFGGGSDTKSVLKFIPKYNTTENVATLPYSASIFSTTTTKLNASSNQVYIFGGSSHTDSIAVFDIDTLETTELTHKLPINVTDPGSISVGNKTFIFSRSSNRGYRVDLRDPDPQFEKGPYNYPWLSYYPFSAATDGRYIYVVGGYGESNTGIPVNGLIQVDPDTFEYRFISVESFPISGAKLYKYPPALVYVEKQNGLYMFGGNVNDGGYYTPSSGIYFIDLTPLYDPLTTTTTEPTTAETAESESTTEIVSDVTYPFTSTLNPEIFSCENKPDGMYPHPYACEKFIGCIGGETQIYECPAPLLFNPVEEACDSPSHVQCDLSCFEKPDGRYPHPHDCALFFICEDSKLEVYKCPPPLLFDAPGSKCNFPDLVSCGIY